MQLGFDQWEQSSFGRTGNMDTKEDVQEVVKSEKAYEKWHLSV